MEFRENVIEWINGQNYVCCTFSQKKFINKIKRFAEKYPSEVKIVSENPEGSIYVRVPLSYLKIGRAREMSEEQKQAARERMKEYQNKVKNSDG